MDNIKKKIKGCIIVFLIISLITHIVNKLIYFLATANRLIEKKKGSVFNWKHGDIYYTKIGSGKPILLIHNLSVFSSSCEWENVVGELSKENTVYSIDLLGCGRSDKPRIDYINYMYVQLITDYVKEIIGERVTVVATNRSANFVLKSAELHPELFDKIFLVNPSEITVSSKKNGKAAQLVYHILHTPVFGTALYNAYTSKNTLDSFFTMDYFYNASKIDDTYINKYYEAAHTKNGEGKFLLASIYAHYLDMDITSTLKKISNKIYLVIGGGNPESRRAAEEYQTENSTIEIFEIEKTKLLPQLENASAFTEIIRSCL